MKRHSNKVSTDKAASISVPRQKCRVHGQIVMVIKTLKYSVGFNAGSSDGINWMKILIYCGLAIVRTARC